MFEIARVKCIENIVEKRRNCSFQCKIGTRFSLRDERLFEISEETTRVDCIAGRVYSVDTS